ncbi:DNA polymerase III subunit gamma/tau [Candidatus Aerophobetes bacterium]|uniref:DNA polymerase III subunit gamma/tau n=1 Tax=Aerophobetes bacterium TaxID=2030807 RepID=A0A2A4YMP1_UNCAE|nr:MAG: DNA polymerase III subunit gamma/tau [Candidatus Aerophobetes bacterium]
MSYYQSLARKFRPQTFGDVCEQEAIIKTLKSAIELNRVSHAYIFSGSRGTGKTTLARIFAKALNCKNLKENQEPCNECSSCKEISSSSSLDVIEIDGASNRGIDDIRKLNESTMYTPSSSPYRIYIIDEVHMLTKEAFNALLKTLEEPPKNVKFFFATTEPHKVLPTIMSRTQRFNLKRISIPNIIVKLQKILTNLSITVEEDALNALAQSAEGSLRDAESLLDQVLCTDKKHIFYEDVALSLGFCNKEAFFHLDRAFYDQDLKVAFALSNQLFEEGKDYGYFLNMLLDHYKKILQIKLGAKNIHEISNSDRKRYEESASVYTTNQCLYILEYLMKWIQTLNQIELKPVFVEMILLHIIRARSQIFANELVERLEALQKSPQEAPMGKVAAAFQVATPPMKVPQEPRALEPTVPEPVVSEPQVPASQEILPQKATPLEVMPQEAMPQTPKAAQETAPIEAQNPKGPTPEPVQEPDSEQTPPIESAPRDPIKLQKHETILRFASVELNGIIKKR